MIRCRPQLSPAVYAALLPRPQVRTVDWAQESVGLPSGSEVKGKIRFDLAPHMIEPLDCADDPAYERVSVMAASRNGKTIAAQCLLAKVAAINPHPTVIADADDRSTKRVIKRTWRLLETVEPLQNRVPPRRLQAADRIELTDSIVWGAWSGSPSTAADFAALVVVKNEVDKWSKRQSDEADFFYLIDERAKGFPNSTIFEISTPSVAGSSQIEAAYLAGDRRQRFVPCPYCNHFQTLRTGDGREPGGLRWKKDVDGKSDPSVARDTAWYECAACGKAIRDEHRYDMLNAGRYVREGQAIDSRGRLRGKPLKPRSRHASFGYLGTHYSLLPSITWGVIAEQAVLAFHDRSGKRLRHFLNSWEGITWNPTPKKVEPHQLAERLVDDVAPGICPEWSRFLTIGIDCGSIGEDLLFYWLAAAWGAGGRGHLVDFGIAVEQRELLDLARRTWPHADGGPELAARRLGVDSGDGNWTNTVYKLCDQLPNGWPVKGSAKEKFPDTYRLGFKVAGMNQRQLAARRKMGLGDLVIVNTWRSQEFVEDLISGKTGRDATDFFSVNTAAAADFDLLDQFLADRLIDGRWEKTGPNEYRDGLRYAWAMAQHFTRGGRDWSNLPPRTGETEVAGDGWFSNTKRRRTR